MKKTGERRKERAVFITMTVPNEEVAYIYENSVLAWFDRKVRESDLTPLLAAIEKGDCKAFGDLLSLQLQETIIFYDYAENYYHGFLTGLLKGIGRYQILSNRESGRGRPDIVMKAASVRGKRSSWKSRLQKISEKWRKNAQMPSVR